MLLPNVNVTINLMYVDNHNALMHKFIHTIISKKILRNRYIRLIKKRLEIEYKDYFIRTSIKGKQVKNSCIGSLVKINKQTKGVVINNDF